MNNENRNTYRNVLITSIIAAILVTSGIGIAYADGYFPGKNSFNAYTNPSGAQSNSFGYVSTASGDLSNAFGIISTAQSYGSFVIGQCNEVSGTMGSWISTEPLFVIGNGVFSDLACVSNANAVTVLKNGDVGIGISNPNARLDVSGDIKLTGNILSDGDICIGNCTP